jgi:threonine aldolase
LFNAAVKQNVEAAEISKHFDSISICLSKGLGAPVGSVLCGHQDQIDSARRWRKVLGGGMRQAGILAAAGIFSLENNIQRLAEDHENAALLAKGLSEIDELDLEEGRAHTNMVFLRLRKNNDQLPVFLKTLGIVVSPGNSMRLVTHLDIKKNDVDTVVNSFKRFFINDN